MTPHRKHPAVTVSPTKTFCFLKESKDWQSISHLSQSCVVSNSRTMKHHTNHPLPPPLQYYSHSLSCPLYFLNCSLSLFVSPVLNPVSSLSVFSIYFLCHWHTVISLYLSVFLLCSCWGFQQTRGFLWDKGCGFQEFFTRWLLLSWLLFPSQTSNCCLCPFHDRWKHNRSNNQARNGNVLEPFVNGFLLLRYFRTRWCQLLNSRSNLMPYDSNKLRSGWVLVGEPRVGYIRLGVGVNTGSWLRLWFSRCKRRGQWVSCRFKIRPQRLPVTGFQSRCNCCQLSAPLYIVWQSAANMSWHLFSLSVTKRKPHEEQTLDAKLKHHTPSWNKKHTLAFI